MSTRGWPVNPQQEHLSLKLVRLKPTEEFSPVHGGLTFIFARGGAGKCLAGTAPQTISPGDILVLNGAPGGKLSVQDKKVDFLFWNFSVCFENLLPLFSGEEISLLHKITESYQAAKIYPAASPLAVECHRLLGVVPPHFDLDHRGQLIRICASILSTEFKEAQGRRSGFSRPDEHLFKVFEKLSASEIINLSVGELAKKFNCSRRHLNRLFHQHFGISVAALRMEMRLLKAVSLLRDPDAKVISVAEQCGFNHLGLFNTCFKRRFGASPGQWRKNAMKPESIATTKHENTTKCPLQATGLCPWGGSIDSQQTAGPKVSTAAKPGAKGRSKS